MMHRHWVGTMLVPTQVGYMMHRVLASIFQCLCIMRFHIRLNITPKLLCMRKKWCHKTKSFSI